MKTFIVKLYCSCNSTGKTGHINSPLQSTIVVSAAFFFVFSAFMSIQALQNSLNMEDGLGVKSLACLYTASIVSSVLAPSVIKLFGGKTTMIAAFCVQTLYTLSNFYPRFYTLIPSSVLLGLLQGPLWTTQNLYVTASAERIAEKHKKSLIHVLNKHNGIFYSVLGVAFASGGIVSSVIFRNDVKMEAHNNITTGSCGVRECSTYNDISVALFNMSNSSFSKTQLSKPNPEIIIQLFSVYLLFDIIGIIITILLLPTLPLSEYIKKKNIQKSVYSMFSSLKNLNLMLFLPMPVAVAVQRFVLYADFTRAYITCPFGVGMVGFIMASYAVTNTVCLQLMPYISKCIKRQYLVVMATIINLSEMILWLFWNPGSDDLPLVFLSGILWGVTDSIWRLEIFGRAAILFADKKEPAFANIHFWRGLFAAVYFAAASYLCVFTILIICIANLSISMVLYAILEFQTKDKMAGETKEEIIDIEEEEEKIKLDNET